MKRKVLCLLTGMIIATGCFRGYVFFKETRQKMAGMEEKLKQFETIFSMLQNGVSWETLGLNGPDSKTEGVRFILESEDSLYTFPPMKKFSINKLYIIDGQHWKNTGLPIGSIVLVNNPPESDWRKVNRKYFIVFPDGKLGIYTDSNLGTPFPFFPPVRVK